MITICATGAVTPMGNSEDVIWENLCNGNPGRLNQKAEFTSVLPGKVRRRINRFADMAMTAAESCFNESQEKQAADKGQIGCIFNTAYGPLETNLEFAKQIIEDDPDACSPILFSNTVHNACLGTIAIQLGITGPSTMLLGSNHLWMSEQMLAEGKAEIMLAGAIEEYNEELRCSLTAFSKESGAYADAANCADVVTYANKTVYMETEAAVDTEVADYVDTVDDTEAVAHEGAEVCSGVAAHAGTAAYVDAAVVFALRSVAEETDGVTIKETVTLNLGVTPFENAEPDKAILSKLLTAKITNYEVDAVILNEPNGKIGKAEKHILQENFPKLCRIDRFYDYFGNSLGADMSMKVLLAKLILEKGTVPACLCGDKKTPEKLERIAVLADRKSVV